MRVQVSARFLRSIKKFTKAQKNELDKAIRVLINNPKAGMQKSGDLAA
jgi:mRNA-degrading endonuclease YafQ of YafQ-DinJ toxin-antitoxin module